MGVAVVVAILFYQLIMRGPWPDKQFIVSHFSVLGRLCVHRTSNPFRLEYFCQIAYTEYNPGFIYYESFFLGVKSFRGTVEPLKLAAS